MLQLKNSSCVFVEKAKEMKRVCFLLLFPAFAAAMLLGCNKRVGINSKPINGVNYSEEATLPVVIKAALPNVNEEFGSTSNWVHTFDAPNSLQIAKDIPPAYLGENLQFVKRSTVDLDDAGRFFHKETNAKGLVWSVSCRGGGLRNKRFRVDCSSGTKSVSLEVSIQVENRSRKWVVDDVKLWPNSD